MPQYYLSLLSLATVLSLSLAFSSVSFYAPAAAASARPTTTTSLFAEGTGGWGLSNSRDMVPEEFANKRSGERKAFEGYKLSDRGEFMRQVSKAKDNLKSDELSELLGVARLAGISVKNPSERLNKFEADVMGEGEDEDLDLSV